VTWECAILQKALYDAQDIAEELADVIFTAADEPCIPRVLRERNWDLAADEAGYEQLHRFLTNQSSTGKPKRGKVKKLPTERAQLHNVPDLPTHVLPRDPGLAALRAKILGGSPQPVGTTSIAAAKAKPGSRKRRRYIRRASRRWPTG